jgi:L-alanine-DL-glutamate epimerase-like enolase superfamily enzyme
VIQIEAEEQSWPLKKPFRIARGTSTEVRTVVVTASNGQHIGRGEAVPISRYNHSVTTVLAEIDTLKCAGDFDRHALQQLLPPGPARNAVDCALWDLEAKTCGKRVWELADVPVRDMVMTAITVSLDTPSAMAAAAADVPQASLLKLKLGGDDLDLARVDAVRRAAPQARLVIDANESWSPSHYREVVPALKQLGVELLEQPFPANADEILESLSHPIPVCADESCHTSADICRLAHRYEMLNIKLDKTGGLTEGLLLAKSARETGFKLLVGCMVCTSLGIAPARVLASLTDYVDLDGPLLLARDRENGIPCGNEGIGLPPRSLWG